MEESIKHLRLINGDEIIGVVLDENDMFICVDHPLVVCQQQTDAGAFVVLKKFLPYTKENIINFQRNHVIASADLHQDIINYYYLSLRLSKLSDDITLKTIRNNNMYIEQMLNSRESEVPLKNKVIHMVEGTESIN